MSWAVRSSASSDVSLYRLASGGAGIDRATRGSMLDHGLQGVGRVADAGKASTIDERDQQSLVARCVPGRRDQPEPVVELELVVVIPRLGAELDEIAGEHSAGLGGTFAGPRQLSGADVLGGGREGGIAPGMVEM